jgi:hypothetical protein
MTNEINFWGTYAFCNRDTGTDLEYLEFFPCGSWEAHCGYNRRAGWSPSCHKDDKNRSLSEGSFSTTARTLPCMAWSTLHSVTDVGTRGECVHPALDVSAFQNISKANGFAPESWLSGPKSFIQNTVHRELWIWYIIVLSGWFVFNEILVQPSLRIQQEVSPFRTWASVLLTSHFLLYSFSVLHIIAWYVEAEV